MAIKFSDALMKEIKRGTKARQGFFVLGELEGSRAFRDNFFMALKENGWPIERAALKKRSDPNTPMDNFIEYALIDTHAFYNKHKQLNVNCWFRYLNADEQAFVTGDTAIGILSKSLDTAIEKTAAQYGDAMSVKHDQKSTLKALRQSAAAWFGFNKDKPETKMGKAFRDVVKLMRSYSDKGVPSYEFQCRITERLEKMKWPINDPDDIHKPLQDELCGLLRATESNNAGYYYRLQDDNVPARKPYRAAKDFLLSNFNDVSKAANDVAAELDKELATQDGLITRHCILAGREDKTNLKKRGDSR
jgi:hypothetical protein